MTSRRVYFDEIEHGRGARAEVLYACLFDADTGGLVISADMPYCLEKIRQRGYVVVKKPIKAEAELKYAAQEALAWMQCALRDPNLREWIDPVKIEMLRVAIGHSTVNPVLPVPDTTRPVPVQGGE